MTVIRTEKIIDGSNVVAFTTSDPHPWLEEAAIYKDKDGTVDVLMTVKAGQTDEERKMLANQVRRLNQINDILDFNVNRINGEAMLDTIKEDVRTFMPHFIRGVEGLDDSHPLAATLKEGIKHLPVGPKQQSEIIIFNATPTSRIPSALHQADLPEDMANQIISELRNSIWPSLQK